MYINGVRVDLAGATFNVYDVIASLRSEYYQMEKLRQLHLNTEEERKVQSLVMQIAAGDTSGGGGGGGPPGIGGPRGEESGKSIIRIDVSRGARHVITFANNLERDAQYSQWPRKLMTLTQPTWSLHSLRRNVYTMIANLDVLTESGAIIMYQLNSMYTQTYPIRFGVVPICDVDDVLASYYPSSPAASDHETDNSKADAEVAALMAYFADRDLTSTSTKLDVCMLFSALRVKKDKDKDADKGSMSTVTGPAVAFDFLNNIAVEIVTKIQQRGEDMAASGGDGDGDGDGEGDDSDDAFLALPLSTLIELYATTMSRNTEFTLGGALSGSKIESYADDAHRVVLGRDRANTAAAAAKDSDLAQQHSLHLSFARNTTVYLNARNLPENSYSINGIVKQEVDMNQVMMTVRSPFSFYPLSGVNLTPISPFYIAPKLCIDYLSIA